jgi:hypothetical protein
MEQMDLFLKMGSRLSSKTPPTPNVVQDVGKKESSYTAGGNVS